MSNLDPRARLIAAGVVAAPVLLVQAAGVWFDAGPRAATASESEETPHAALPPAPATIPAPAPEEERVAAYVEELRSAALGPSPFYYEPRAEAPVSEAEAAAPPAPVEAAPLKVSLGAIMAMREGAIALINGQPHREGDAISGDGSDGWRIIAIDSSEGSVTFEHESGRRETRTVRRQ